MSNRDVKKAWDVESLDDTYWEKIRELARKTLWSINKTTENPDQNSIR